MPIVNPDQLLKEAKAKEEAEKSVTTKLVGTKRIFLGDDGKWYDSHGEALDSLQRAKQLKEYKEKGLNEYGQSKEDVEKSAKIKTLIGKRNKLIERIHEIEAEIGQVKSAKPETKPETKKKK